MDQPTVDRRRVDVKLTINASASGPEGDGDTIMLSLPPKFRSTPLPINQLTEYLTALSHSHAERCGEKLHHADYWITTNPTTVTEQGVMHADCDKCRAGIRMAGLHFAQTPNVPLIVGQLFWRAQ